MLEENLILYPVMTPFGCNGACHITVVHSRCTAFGRPGTAGMIIKALEGGREGEKMGEGGRRETDG